MLKVEIDKKKSCTSSVKLTNGAYFSIRSFSSFLDPCRGVSCPYFGMCVPKTSSPRGYECQCQVTCPPDVSKVCGSDGRTYRSKCELRRESCSRRITILPAYTGSCGKTVMTKVYQFSLREDINTL